MIRTQVCGAHRGSELRLGNRPRLELLEQHESAQGVARISEGRNRIRAPSATGVKKGRNYSEAYLQVPGGLCTPNLHLLC